MIYLYLNLTGVKGYHTCNDALRDLNPTGVKTDITSAMMHSEISIPQGKNSYHTCNDALRELNLTGVKTHAMMHHKETDLNHSFKKKLRLSFMAEETVSTHAS